MLEESLKTIGIALGKEFFYNLSYEELFKHETGPSLSGFERVQMTTLGAVNVDTGVFTGRSPEDKYVVCDEVSKDTIWWQDLAAQVSSDNKAMSKEAWEHLRQISVGQLSGKRIYIMDGFCGANPDSRMNIRLVTEVAWMAHFFKNLFIRPTLQELRSFKPDWTILNACKTSCIDFAKYNMRSGVFVAFNFKERMTVIGGTWYSGEIKKGIFSIMNYFLPLKGIGSFHCSANKGKKEDTALFFGLSGTGKTTLSNDPKRQLLGDDEHGWDSQGVFNLEGGCYAKCIGLTQEKEPEIFAAIRRNAILENCDVDESGRVDFTSSKKTENTRVSYPLEHIENIVRPVSMAGHPNKIIFLACDAYGVLPPVAQLTPEQAMYHFLSGYTAKIAGTEIGVKEPKATFSACFGKAFLMLHPTKYAQILAEKMREHQAQAYLINTGWVAGKYGIGYRIPLKENRLAIDAVLDGSIADAGFVTMPVFGLKVPKAVKGANATLLDPRNAWQDKEAYDRTIQELAELFIENFRNFTDTAIGKILVSSGPHVPAKTIGIK